MYLKLLGADNFELETWYCHWNQVEHLMLTLGDNNISYIFRISGFNHVYLEANDKMIFLSSDGHFISGGAIYNSVPDLLKGIKREQ